MILGRNRLPYAGPPQANPNFRPTMVNTRFLTHMDPFAHVSRRMAAYDPFHPMTMPNSLGPAPMMPVAPPTPPTPVTPGAAAAPIPPTAAMHGAFGSTGGVKAHFHMNPYTVMRQGLIPGVRPDANHLRWGVRHAHSWVEQSMPFQTAPLPPPPPPPPPPVAVAPGGTKGFFGALLGRHHYYRRARHRHWWQWNPPSTEEQSAAVVQNDGCEWIPNSVTGISKQICNGRVVSYKDAQGNVLNPADYGAYPEGGMSGGLGFSWPHFGFRRFGHHPHARRFHPGFHPRFRQL